MSRIPSPLMFAPVFNIQQSTDVNYSVIFVTAGYLMLLKCHYCLIMIFDVAIVVALFDT